MLDFKLKPGESVTFRYRILLYSGDHPDDKKLNSEAKNFSK